MNSQNKLLAVLELARWAPSGDNTQPWRFEVLSSDHVVVHGFDTRRHCVYDFDGRPSQMSHGALLETMDVAASTVGWSMSAVRRPGPDESPTFDVRFTESPGRAPDSLAAVITTRSVQRRPLKTRALTASEKSVLEAAAGPGHSLVWLEGWSLRWRCAWLMFANAKIRLTMPEAYEVHRSVIAWGCRNSVDKVPDQALGADPLTLLLMKHAMKSWRRIEFMNSWLAGTLAPRLQMDLMPGLACAAHFAIIAKTPPCGIDDWVDAGRAIQRVWLTTTHLGLQKQPELTPVIFSRYVDAGRNFSCVAGLYVRAYKLRDRLASLLGKDLNAVVWMARVGAGEQPVSRSLRVSLDELMCVSDQNLKVSVDIET